MLRKSVTTHIHKPRRTFRIRDGRFVFFTQMRCAVKPLQPLQWLHFYDAIARVLQSHRNGFSVALHCHCGNRSERKHWNFNGCAAIALPFFLAWNYCDGFAKPLLGIMQPLQWFWDAIAMVLRSHCNGLAEKADRCLFCMVSHLLLYYCWVDYAVPMYWVVIYHTTM